MMENCSGSVCAGNNVHHCPQIHLQICDYPETVKCEVFRSHTLQTKGMSRKGYDCSLRCYACADCDVELPEET